MMIVLLLLVICSIWSIQMDIANVSLRMIVVIIVSKGEVFTQFVQTHWSIQGVQGLIVHFKEHSLIIKSDHIRPLQTYNTVLINLPNTHALVMLLLL